MEPRGELEMEEEGKGELDCREDWEALVLIFAEEVEEGEDDIVPPPPPMPLPPSPFEPVGTLLEVKLFFPVKKVVRLPPPALLVLDTVSVETPAPDVTEPAKSGVTVPPIPSAAPTDAEPKAVVTGV